MLLSGRGAGGWLPRGPTELQRPQAARISCASVCSGTSGGRKLRLSGHQEPSSKRPGATLKRSAHAVSTTASSGINPQGGAQCHARTRPRDRRKKPGRDSSQRRSIGLNRRLKKSGSLREVAAIIEQNHQDFDHINVSTALTLLGRYSADSSSYTQPGQDHTLKWLEAHVVARASEYGPQGIANSACGLAKLGAGSTEAFEALRGQALAKVAHFKPQELTMTAWAFAKVNHPADDLFAAIRDLALPRLSAFNAQEVATLAWAFSTARRGDDDLFAALGEQGLRKLQQLTPQGVAMMAWAMARAGMRDPKLFEALGGAAQRRLRHFDTQAMVMLAWAMATAGYRSSELLLRPLARRVTTKLGALSCQDIAVLAWSYATAGLRDRDLFRALGREAVRRADGFSPQGLTNLVWAFSTVQHAPSEALFSAVAASAARQLDRFSPHDVAMTAWAFAASKHHDPQLLCALREQALPRLGEFDAQKLTWTAWAFGSLAHYDAELLEGIRAEALSRIGEFNGQELAMMAWSLAVFDLLDSRTLKGISPAIGALEEELQPEGLQSLFQATMAASLHPAAASSDGEDSEDEPLLPPKVHSAARSCWLASVEETSQSWTQLSVQSAMLRMGLSCTPEWRTPDGLFAVDVLVRLPGGMEVAVEVDGPTHFTMTEPRRELGATLLRRRLLAARLPGPSASVPYFEWDQVCGDHVREEAYLREKLGLGTDPLPALTAAPTDGLPTWEGPEAGICSAEESGKQTQQN